MAKSDDPGCQKGGAAGPVILTLIVAAVWLGMLLGVSFLATPVKFMAPSLSLPVALDVGRHTFAVYNKTELLLSAILLGFALLGARSRTSLIAIVLVVGLVVAQTVWLLPVLDSRVGMIIAGQPPAASNLHMLYIVLDVVKLLGLLLVVVDMARRAVGGAAQTIRFVGNAPCD